MVLGSSLGDPLGTSDGVTDGLSVSQSSLLQMIGQFIKNFSFLHLVSLKLTEISSNSAQFVSLPPDGKGARLLTQLIVGL